VETISEFHTTQGQNGLHFLQIGGL
jgi:hypothetical protein